MKIEVLSQAKEDIFEGYVFYERHEKGAGEYFINSVSSDIDSLLLHHGYHRTFYGFHRMLSRVFPFSIYYRVIGDTICVDAIVDHRRNPESIKHLLLRLKRRE